MIRLEIAALYAGLNILILFLLAWRVIGVRRSAGIVLGDAGNDVAIRRIRAHANAAEYIPAGIAGLTLLALLDPATPAWLLHAAGASLTAGRVLHGVGLNLSALNWGRMLGMALTFVSYALLAGGLIYAALTQQV